jgi:membrane fusion protein, copper/silver efflux system
MQRLFFAAFGLVLAAAIAAPPAEAGTLLQLLNHNVTSGVVSQLRVQLLDDSGKPASGAIVVKSLRADMGPDNMKDMTAPAKALSSTGQGVVVVETNLYAPGRWAVTLSGTVGGKPFSGSLVVTVTVKKTEAALPPPVAARKILYYRNPMGLADTSPTPRKDAMGMSYIPVYADEVSRTPGAIHLTVEKMQRAGVRLDTVKRMPLARTIRATALVAADENRQGVLTARFSGFVEKLYVSQTGDVVRSGQPLMRVWVQGTDVLAREADYIGALESKSEVYAAQAAAMLRQYGVSASDLAAMAKSSKPTRIVTLLAPMSGTVMEKPAVAGMRFSAGDTLFRTIDVSHLWVLAEVGERDLALVKAGQSAMVTFRDDPDMKFFGKVLLVYPELDGVTRTAKVRIAVANAAGALRIGQYADVRIEAPVGNAPVLTIPASAVIDDGTRTVVFVSKPGGLFEPRALKLGFRSSDVVEVRAGLQEGENIVVSGNFLIDAESNLQTALQSFQPAGAHK